MGRSELRAGFDLLVRAYHSGPCHRLNTEEAYPSTPSGAVQGDRLKPFACARGYGRTYRRALAKGGEGVDETAHAQPSGPQAVHGVFNSTTLPSWKVRNVSKRYRDVGCVVCMVFARRCHREQVCVRFVQGEAKTGHKPE